MSSAYKKFMRRNRKLSILMMLATAFGQITTLAVLTTPSQAFASLPGEANRYTEELAGGAPVRTESTLNEARQGSILLRVWRGFDDQVTLSWGAETPFNLGGTQTYQAPTVVPFGTDQFMILHTGVNDQIYYTFLNTTGAWTGYWMAVPFQYTTMQVSATQMEPGSQEVYMVYRGTPDHTVWGTLFQNGYWRTAEDINGGEAPSAPSVTYNTRSLNPLWVAARGEDNHLWMVNGSPGSWRGWQLQNNSHTTWMSPSIATSPTGNMVLSFVDAQEALVFYGLYNQWGTPINFPSADTTGWQTNAPLNITQARNALFVILTGLNGIAYYKQLTNN
jgi:hypothetical protein